MKKKPVLGIMLVLLLASMSALAFNIQPVRAIVLTVPDDFPSIQEAINQANEGDIIFVRAGLYFENLVVDKPVSLVGENRSETIIDANGGYGVRITSNNAELRSFTIRRGYFVDVRVYEGCSGTRISNNIITDAAGWGIYLGGSQSTIIDLNLMKNCGEGIFLESASHNLLVNNTIAANHRGVVLTRSPHVPEVPPPPPSSFNTIYHNSFINNDVQAYDWGYCNVWDNGYPSGGNYWSDYNGVDRFQGVSQNITGGDGIGDTPYDRDRYPLVKPLIEVKWDICDINHDFKIDIKDVAIVALAFGSYPSHPRWNPVADITGPTTSTPDNRVDIRDIALVAKDFGRTYP